MMHRRQHRSRSLGSVGLHRDGIRFGMCVRISVHDGSSGSKVTGVIGMCRALESYRKTKRLDCEL